MLWSNPRYVFFKEELLPDPAIGPRGAQAVPLTPGRSIAVDPQSVPYGTPVWLDTTEPLSSTPLRRLVWRTTLSALLILAAGWLLSRTGSAAAAQTGLGSAFFGATFVAVATSLPEISTMVAAVRLRRYEMALGDIFGTNLFNAALVFLTDLLAPGPPLLSSIGAFAAFGALLGLVLTAIFLAGVVERRDRTVLRMGVDSLAALLVYGGGVALLYALRGQVGG